MESFLTEPLNPPQQRLVVLTRWIEEKYPCVSYTYDLQNGSIRCELSMWPGKMPLKVMKIHDRFKPDYSQCRKSQTLRSEFHGSVTMFSTFTSSISTMKSLPWTTAYIGSKKISRASMNYGFALLWTASIRTSSPFPLMSARKSMWSRRL